MSGQAVCEIEASDFKEKVLNSPRLSIVYFWASWCGPCRSFAPEFEAVALSFKSKADFFKVNTDDSMELAVEFGIMSIPTIVLFENGQERERAIGALEARKLFKSFKSQF